MKPKTVGLPSIYDEKAFKKAGFRVDKLYLFGILVLLLVVIRFANLGLWWYMTHLEITHKAADPEIKYTFLHFSSGEKALAKCRELSQQPSAPPVIVVGYFNLFNPAVFVVHNRATFAALADLGRVVAPLKPGTYTFTFYLSDLLEQLEHQEQPGKPGDPGQPKEKVSTLSVQTAQNTKQARLGTSILLNFLNKKIPAAQRGVSFILKTMAKLKFLDIPYLVYFYLPMVLILILNLVYSRAVLTAFFYYAGLFLLFDFKEIFFRVPFDAVLPVLRITETDSFEGVAAVAAAVILTMLGFVGLFSWKERRDRFKEGLIVLFFIFLPVFLRF